LGDLLLLAFLMVRDAKAAPARRGLLVVGGAPPITPGPGSSPAVAAPSTDHAGRPITTTPDAGAEQALTGVRLTSPATPDGWQQFALGADGALSKVTFDGAGTCLGGATGGWTVKGAWRYPEHGGGLIARLGRFIGEPVDERVVDLPQAEPGTAYLDGIRYTSDPGAAATCAPY
jgi:hypothetical protein